MQNKLVQHKIVVKPSNIHGYGVFAENDIEEGEIFEECHVLFTNKNSDFNSYLFEIDDKRNALPLGFGCIYNHSSEPNAAYYFDAEKQLMIFKARRKIHAGEEIFTYYGHDWFAQRGVEIKEISFLRKVIRFFSGTPLRAFLACMYMYLITQLLGSLTILLCRP